MKSLAITFILLACSAMLFGQTLNMDISKVGPKTQEVDNSHYFNIYYVSQNNGNDKKGDGTKNNPWQTVVYALQTVNGETENHPVALFVAEGIYSGSTIEMKQFIDLYGGFNAENWERDIYKYSTILDGREARRVVVGADDSKLDGFTVENGLSRSHGGGILCDDSAPEISNCFIVNNYVLEPGDFNIERIHQHGNLGGGVACLYNATPVIENNLFYNNKTSIGDGGALSFYGWTRKRHGTNRRIENNFMVGYVRPVVRNNVFVENTAGINDVHRTRSSNGGAISCSNEGRPIIENNVIASNRSKGNSDAGGVYSEDFSYPTIKGNWIIGNIADDDGGGIYIMRLSDAHVEDNFIAGNWTMNRGVGGVRLSKEGRAQITGNIIVHNQSGGGVQCVDSYMELKNNVIMNNEGKYSILFSDAFSYFKPSIVEDNIVRGNKGHLALDTKGNDQIIIRNNNFDEKVDGAGNINKKVNLNKKNISGEIKSLVFNDHSYLTEVNVNGNLNSNSLTGHVIRIGDFWSVIEKISNNKIYVWGNAGERSNGANKFEILSNYQIQK